jgi:N-acetylglucosamine kinase-like BadF-type ATPase
VSDGRLIAAVDGGNSKTDVAILDGAGRVLATGRGPGASFEPRDHAQSMADLERTVRRVADRAGLDAGPVADIGVFCLAGADLPADDRRILRALVAARLVSEPVVQNDTFAVLRAGAPRGWGVAVVCGAGFNCSGVGPDGRRVRFPALGRISGDWGGGWALATDALAAATRATDGRGPATALRRTVPAHFGLRTPLQLLQAVHTGRVDEERLHELVPVVFRTAEAGDAVARGLIEHQADEIAAMVCSAVRRLHVTRTDVDVVLGGGVARARNPILMSRVTELVLECAPAAAVSVVDVPPVVGAALVGLDRLGAADGAEPRLRKLLSRSRFAAVG